MAEGLRYVLALKYLATYIYIRGFEPQLPFLDALLGHTLQFIEGILAVLSLVSTCLRHAAHPFQLRAVQIVGTRYLGPLVVDAFLTFLQVVGVVAAIGIDGLVVQFEDDAADAVEEVAVVGHHQQRPVATLQVALQPFYHLQVQVVRWLVEYQQVRLCQQHIGQCHALLLSA